MPSPRRSRPSPSRAVAVALLIVAIARVPLPTPDYHNVRHHDGPNEVCEHHDHLLRWHPDADERADVAILHWHWMAPLAGEDDGGNGSTAPGPRLHAHVPDPPGFPDEAGPSVSGEAEWGRAGASARATAGAGPVLWADSALAERAGPHLAGTAARAVLHPGRDAAATAARLQRWTC